MSVFDDFEEWYRGLGGIKRSAEPRMKALLATAYRAGARRGAVAAAGGVYPDGFTKETEEMLRGDSEPTVEAIE